MHMSRRYTNIPITKVDATDPESKLKYAISNQFRLDRPSPLIDAVVVKIDYLA